MGSWSVYCSVSNIAITAGQKCVLLPLKKERRAETYLPYLPAMLPIFGKYDDYGGMEELEENKNTKLLEEYFGVSIEELVQYFVDGKYTYERGEYKDIKKKIKHLEEIEDWDFMFIDRKVYDFMSVHVDNYSKGKLDFGRKEMMEALGFKFIEKSDEFDNYDPKRFNQLWKHGKKKFLSDGTTLMNYGKKGNYIHYASDENRSYSSASSLSNHITIPDNMLWIKDVAAWQNPLMSDKKKKEQLGWIVGYDRHSDWMSEDLEELMAELHAKAGEEPKPKAIKDLKDLYISRINDFTKELSELVTIRHNLYCMSSYFQPFVLYLTPQCGEYRQHQALLDKFAEINKSYLTEEED